MVVNIYDTLYDSLDTSTDAILNCLYEKGSKYRVANISKQRGGKGCGVYTIAISTLLVNNLDPEKFTFFQEEMQEHLIKAVSRQYTKQYIISSGKSGFYEKNLILQQQ